MKPSAHFKFALALGLLALLAFGGTGFAQSRVKDVAFVVGARDNDLIGYGVVVGLAGQGDSDPTLTKQTIASIVRRFGIQTTYNDIKAKNSAVVMVTARIGAFARNGSKLDVTVSSMSDAKSLAGGTLLQAPLLGANGKVYAVAQGPLALGGFFAGVGGPGGATVQKNHPTAGRIPNGALVEQEIPTDLFHGGVLEVTLREPDFTSAVRMSNAINEQIGPLAFAVNSSTVRVFLPAEAQEEQGKMDFIARVENVNFRPDCPARVVINEKTGTIVANAKIRIHSVAVAHGNLTVNISSHLDVSQPNPFTGNVIGDLRGGSGGSGGVAAQGVAGVQDTPLNIGGRIVYEDDYGKQVQVPSGVVPPPGYRPVFVKGTSQAAVPSPGAPGGNVTVAGGPQTVVTQSVTTTVDEPKVPLVVFDDLPTVEEVASALNALGVTPRDMMTIFQAMKQAGALQAELILQ